MSALYFSSYLSVTCTTCANGHIWSSVDNEVNKQAHRTSPLPCHLGRGLIILELPRSFWSIKTWGLSSGLPTSGIPLSTEGQCFGDIAPDEPFSVLLRAGADASRLAPV